MKFGSVWTLRYRTSVDRKFSLPLEILNVELYQLYCCASYALIHLWLNSAIKFTPHEEHEAQLWPNYFRHSASAHDSLSPTSLLPHHLYEENYLAKTDDALKIWSY